ncbi:MAG: AAA family ATPase [Planctomycetota bacterium]|jgi:predicted ATP-dependent protease|nr:AAA family ATPase [Planctomycetota bacterium]
MAARSPKKAKVSPSPRTIRPSELRWNCPASWIPKAKNTKSSSDPLSAFIGQDRALEALEMGLAVDSPGYNIFVAGLEGGEKFDNLRPLLDRVRFSCPRLQDHVYLHNFADPVRPQHMSLPAGGGPELASAMQDWVAALQREIPRALETEEHLNRRNKLFRRYAVAEEQLFRRLSKRAETAGLVLVQVEDDQGTRPDFFLPVGEEAISIEKAASLDKKERPSDAKLRRMALTREGLRVQLSKASHKARLIGLRLSREVQRLDELRTQDLVRGLTIAAAEELGADEELAAWQGDCAGFALNNLHLFRRHEDDDEDSGSDSEPIGLEVFEVNVVRTVNEEGCPTVFELHPNYSNLFGVVERRRLRAGPGFFHLAVRPGSLLAADGGVLVLNARDVFKEAEVWRVLKRCLQNHVLEIHALESISPLGVTGVRPEPAPFDLKVVLVGDNDLYDTLHDSDFDFRDIFKVKAEFDDNLPLQRRNVGRLCRALRDLASESGLLPFSTSGLQALVERAVNDAGRQNRISACVHDLFDYAREASYWASKNKKRRIDRAAVDLGRQQFRHQHDVETEWSRRSVLDGIFEIATSGTRVGSINGLTVVNLGPLNSGRVARISASVSAGDDSCINVERDVDLSGPIHNKGVLLLEAFLRNRFGQKRSLPIKATLAFDQSYGPIDGDSASSTEVYALLSAISGIPLRQDLAVTGAVSMTGEILAIGGVNEKITGFFDLCSARGLTGKQGVLIPAANIDNLMLQDKVLEACKAGRFHIWAVRTVDEGISLLTGLPAGKRGKGGWSAESVMDQVEKALDRYEKDQKGEAKEKQASSEDS